MDFWRCFYLIKLEGLALSCLRWGFLKLHLFSDFSPLIFSPYIVHCTYIDRSSRHTYHRRPWTCRWDHQRIIIIAPSFLQRRQREVVVVREVKKSLLPLLLLLLVLMVAMMMPIPDFFFSKQLFSCLCSNIVVVCVYRQLFGYVHSVCKARRAKAL